MCYWNRNKHCQSLCFLIRVPVGTAKANAIEPYLLHDRIYDVEIIKTQNICNGENNKIMSPQFAEK